MILLALAAFASLQTADDAAGRYVAESDTARWDLSLRPAAAQLPESNIEGEAASGFAFASPGCPARVAEAAFWRLTLADGALTLVDGAGDTVFAGRAEGRDWAGETPGGAALRLTRK
jgi:hypothetical protein